MQKFLRSLSLPGTKAALPSAFTLAEMRFPHANLSAIGFTERAGNNDEPILEQLFDKLFKKALTHVENNTNEIHINGFLK